MLSPQIDNAFNSGFAGGATVAQLAAQVPGFAKPNYNAIANKLYNPKYYEWNFEVQQTLSKRALLSVNYVGNKGYQEINQSVFGNAYTASPFAGLPTRAPDPRFGEIRTLNNQGFSNYNGLVTSVKLAHQCIHRLLFLHLEPCHRYLFQCLSGAL